MSDVQNPISAPEATDSNTNITPKGPSRFARARHATHRALKRGTTDITVWTTATMLTIAEPIVEVGKVVVHTADTKEDQVREFGRKFVERRHARLIARSQSEVEQLKVQLAAAKAAVVDAAQQMQENPAPEAGTSLRPQPATS